MTIDDEAEPQEFSLTRDRVARVLAMLEAKHANGGLDPGETKALEVATLRLYGAGASPKKFARLDAQQVDGVLRGQYRFAGAGQTGRMTSAGRKFKISPAMSSARMVPRKPRSSMRSPTAAATPRWPRRSLSMCRRRASWLCSCVLPSLRAWGKRSSGRIGRRSRRGSRPGSPLRRAPRRVLDIFRANDRRPVAAGHLHDRRRRHPAQGDRAR